MSEEATGQKRMSCLKVRPILEAHIGTLQYVLLAHWERRERGLCSLGPKGPLIVNI